MPEYLAPGVYVEEIDTGSKPIEGVSTSTSGMVGITERGPVNETTLVTGFADYRRQFGGFLNRRVFTGANWLFPHSVDGFFTNGGKRLYLVRVLPDAAAYATMQLFGAVSAGFTSTLASASRPGEQFLIVDDPTNLAPGDWLLVRRLPNGEETVVAKSVVAFDVSTSGDVLVSDGCGIDHIHADGTTTKRVSRAQRVLALVAMGPA